MIKPMSRIADSFWRAAAYCLHPRVIGLSLLPLIVSALFVPRRCSLPGPPWIVAA